MSETDESKLGLAADGVKLGLSADEVLQSTRAVRKRLDFDRPVPESVLRECIEVAVQAPTGSNMQGWHFVFVTERDKIEAISALYKKGFDSYRNSPMYAGRVASGLGAQRAAQQARVTSSAEYLSENMGRSPVLFIPCIAGRTDDPRMMVGQAGSIIPAAWSFMLAARERGLGTCWTTLHLGYEREAAEILGIPYDKVRQYALSPVAYTQGTDFKLATRTDLDSVMSWNSWSR
ncbi:nitroreductase family protein [Candidatus Poriferisodalis sp.]|uniref:nitroreductase family protein n=1 Tax=Candidatus Poriferisodalis sp. TaxID=3101277 RepID=UPI003B51D58A